MGLIFRYVCRAVPDPCVRGGSMLVGVHLHDPAPLFGGALFWTYPSWKCGGMAIRQKIPAGQKEWKCVPMCPLSYFFYLRDAVDVRLKIPISSLRAEN